MPPSIVVRVRHSGKQFADVVVVSGDDVSPPTVADLRRVIATNLRIPLLKQRLVGSDRRWRDDAARLEDILGPHVPLPVSRDAGPPEHGTGVCGGPGVVHGVALLPAHVPPHVMVLGQPESRGTVGDDSTRNQTSSDEEPKRDTITAEALVCGPVEAEEGVYTCSYAAGYIAQEAFYCRTCADAGHAEAQHFVCFACAEVCHASHVVENWGVHNFLRCDCSTAAGCTTSAIYTITTTAKEDPDASSPNVSVGSGREGHGKEEADVDDAGDVPPLLPRRCVFVTEESTGLPPRDPAPRNALNRYPSEHRTWCFCRGADAADEEMEEGLNCIMCHNVFYASHMTCLNTDLYRLVSCYAETSGCNTLAYHCLDCNPANLYCPPCILNCHAGHRISEVPVTIANSGTTTTIIEGGCQDEDAPADGDVSCRTTAGVFQCGCRAACSLAQTVPDVVLMDVTSSLRQAALPKGTKGGDSGDGTVVGVEGSELRLASMSRKLVEDDEICGFLCSDCMRRAPWLWRFDLAAQDLTELRRCRNGEYPILPLEVPFANQSHKKRCDVVACRHPPTPLAGHLPYDAAVFPYHGMLVPDDIKAFLCQCSPCQSSLSSLFPRRIAEQSQQLFIPFDNNCHVCGERVAKSEGYLCATCELWQEPSFLLCASCYEVHHASIAASHSTSVANDMRSKGITRPPGGGGGQHHATLDTVHEFVKETFDNVWRLFGASLVHQVDRETKQWMLQHWNEPGSREMVLEWMRTSFGARRVGEEEGDGVATSTSKKRHRSEEDGDGDGS